MLNLSHITTLQLITMSINKWLGVVEGALEHGMHDCPLCSRFKAGKEFNRYTNEECDGCPVALLTGSKYCSRTPYLSYNNKLPEKERREAAMREVEFLRDVRAWYMWNRITPEDMKWLCSNHERFSELAKEAMERKHLLRKPIHTSTLFNALDCAERG